MIGRGKGRVAILIVHGGRGPRVNDWLDLCLQKITDYTRGSNYLVYVWNNNIKDQDIPVVVSRYPRTQLFQADTEKKLAHAHAVPLQKLYELARKDKAKYIVTLDTDAFPIRDGWLRCLIKELDKGAAIAGIWRDELAGAIAPYIHPSCLCTTEDFIEGHGLRFDTVDLDPDQKVDTLSTLTRAAQKGRKKIYKLRRTNKNQAHYLMAGIYGHLIYHHGAGSRKKISFWGEERTEKTHQENARLRDLLDLLILQHQAPFLHWLIGRRAEGGRQAGRLLVLGLNDARRESLLSCLSAGGLPVAEDYSAISTGEPGKQFLLREKLKKLEMRLLSRPDIAPIGIYTHPETRARPSGASPVPSEAGIAIWCDYHRWLLAIHQRLRFPLLKFDLTEPKAWLDILGLALIEQGYNPDLPGIAGPLRNFSAPKKAAPPVPASCRELYRTLEEIKFTSEGHRFAHLILKLKKG
jgi:hypothetical protein